MTKVIIEQQSIVYTTEDLCGYCTIDSESIEEFVELGIIEPEDMNSSQWQFSMTNYLRLRKALRLTQDLEINLPGAALALELLDEIERLQRQLTQSD
ncbi:MAG: chaperone modulatory protein CbpM [Cellvibrionaceae bacterium]|jgi:chaperone modulatory protein CbpM